MAARLLVRDTGKPLSQALGEVNATSMRVKYLASIAQDTLKPQEVRSRGTMTELILREPLGIVANISAWNYPYFVGSNVWAAALLAGNAVLYKPSEYCPGTASFVADLWRMAGLPDGFFQVMSETRQAGQFIIQEADVDAICFTGSVATGRIIAATAAPRMIKLQLELGGKDPAYVCDDVADITQVAQALADGAFYNAGQSCCSVERIYVHEKVYDTFVEAFVQEVNSFQVGSEWDASTYLGPLCLPSQPAFLRRQVDDAISKGAKVVTKKIPCLTPRHFVPTVLIDVDHSMDIMREESFGPVIGIQKVHSDAESVALMDDTTYGLTASVYTDDKQRALSILGQLKTGTAYWNACDRVSPYLPWSGRRDSGIGATLSHIGILSMTHPRAYHLNSPTVS
uniref:Aldehyde dehydrogenase domain-containing protein n=1 Tax=Aureoumbra lagunensis TaxID=44058 RepID=A0A7S3JSH8_9STRA